MKRRERRMGGMLWGRENIKE